MELEVENHLKTLSRGLMNDDPYGTYSGYCALYKIGHPALPALTKSVLKCDVSVVKYKELTRYVVGLISLIHDIDENKGKSVIDKVKSNGCVDHLRVQLESISQFSLKGYDKYDLKGIEVIEHKELAPEGEIRTYLENWIANIPEKDLEGVVRLVVCKPEDIKAAGTYMPMLQKIAIAWHSDLISDKWLHRFFLFSTEHTFYHEVGHHVHRHTFGQIPQQEKEANAYAAKLMKVAHPKTVTLIRLLGALKLFPRKNC